MTGVLRSIEDDLDAAYKCSNMQQDSRQDVSHLNMQGHDRKKSSQR